MFGGPRATNRAMRLLIHAAGIACGGGLRHVTGFIPALAEELARRRWRAWITLRAEVMEALPLVDAAVELVGLRQSLAGSAAARLAIDQAWVPALAHRHRADVVVSLANFGPLAPGRPHVVFQTNATYFEPDLVTRASGKARVRIELRRRFAAATMRRASVVVTPSESMAQLVRAAEPGVAARCMSLLHGIDRLVFTPAQRPAARRPFVFLVPGVAAPYKGLDVLIDALAILGAGDYVVRAFGNEWDWPDGLAAARARAASTGVSAHLQISNEVAQGDMPALYASADALIHPSQCESFGFTLLEALASALPVVATDLPVNREIAGDAALYCEARSPEALAGAMRRVLQEDAVRADLSRRASEGFTRFDWSWQRYVRDFLDICERARAAG